MTKKRKIILMSQALCFGLAVLLSHTGCKSGRSTSDIPAVSGFEPEKYMGRWYEIARLPHWFERDLDRVTADYTLEPDGRIRVVNRGWRKGKEAVARGWAKSAGKPDIGELRVSFFRPFYGDYRIIDLSPSYQYAVVTGSTRDYFWILARHPEMEPELRERLLERARTWGFAVEQIEFPDHSPDSAASGVNITSADNGRTVKLSTGAKARITLEENPSTGYSWVYRNSAPEVCFLSRDDFIPSGSNYCGAAGVRVLELRAVAGGVCVIELSYLRSWEKDQPPAKTFSVKIKVEE